MSVTATQRPGVYSSYTTSRVISGGRGSKVIGIAAKAADGEQGRLYTITGYEQAAAIFGSDSDDATMMGLVRILFLNGAARIVAAPIRAETVTTAHYIDAFGLLETADEISIVVCGSDDDAVVNALKQSVDIASENRRERIAVAGVSNHDASEAVEAAEQVNNKRVVLCAPRMLGEDGETLLSGAFTAAAVAGAFCKTADPALPLNGAALYGFGGVGAGYSDAEVDLLISGGVTPIESVGGEISIIRVVSSKTKEGQAPDKTWKEITTILVADDVISTVRNALRARFARGKNTALTREAIKTQVVIELENKVQAQIIDGYTEPVVTQSDEEPTVCDVQFGFEVVHGLNQIHLSAHIYV